MYLFCLSKQRYKSFWKLHSKLTSPRNGGICPSVWTDIVLVTLSMLFMSNLHSIPMFSVLDWKSVYPVGTDFFFPSPARRPKQRCDPAAPFLRLWTVCSETPELTSTVKKLANEAGTFYWALMYFYKVFTSALVVMETFCLNWCEFIISSRHQWGKWHLFCFASIQSSCHHLK